MRPEALRLWGSLTGQRLMLRGEVSAEQRARFAPLMAQLKAIPKHNAVFSGAEQGAETIS